ncbi:MAG TPA: nuclear transport factor 2 family protein [Vicinamibacterales bacterium]|nr:nuclear transport factor 2 family protein [Vicinamibacterales bacterium]
MPDPTPPGSQSYQSARAEAAQLLRQINDAWLEGRPRDLTELFHPDIVMVLPGFAGSLQGRQQMIDGFTDFCASAKVHAFDLDEPHIDVIGRTAVASVLFSMIYERQGQRFRSTGRDVWVFTREAARWLAVWRVMVDVTDEAV